MQEEERLRARSRREGWTRDDGEAARVAARQALASESAQAAREIGAHIGAQQARAYVAAVEHTVLSALDVTREHQFAVRRGMDTALQLLRELEFACDHKELSELEADGCRGNDAARAALIDRQLGLKGRLDAFDRWATSFAKLTNVEREVHDLGAASAGQELDELLLRIHAERAIKSH